MNSSEKNHNFPKFYDIANKYKANPNRMIKKLENLKNNIQKFSDHRILPSNFESDIIINNVYYLQTSSEFVITRNSENYNFKLNIEKFISLKLKPFINLISFCDNFNILSLFNSNKRIRSLIIILFQKYILSIIDKFEKAYSKYLKIHNHKICFIQQNNLINISFVIISEIYSNSIINKCVKIGYYSKFFCDKENYRNTYLIDVYDVGKPLSFWIMKENTRVLFI